MQKIIKVSPTLPEQRFEIIDIIRGFALFGVLVFNIYCFNMPPLGYISKYEPVLIFDKISYWIIRILIAGKFYTLFSFLFGLGFAIQIERLKKKTTHFKFIYFKRLAILLGFGILHSILIWSGDILKYYGLIGFFLLFFHSLKTKKLIKWSVTLLVIFHILLSTVYIVKSLSSEESVVVQQEETVKENPEKELDSKVYQTGDYWQVTKKRVQLLSSTEQLPYLLAGLLYLLPIFLLGAYFGSRKVLQNLNDNLRLIKKIFFWSLITGLSVSVVYLYFGLTTSSGDKNLPRAIMKIAELFSNIPLCLFYISSILLIYRKKIWKKIYKPLASTGRLALTNYLCQSLFFTWLFYHYGLNFQGMKSVTLLIVMSIVFFIFQILFSRWWIIRFSIGPAEWLWRSLTYKKWQSFLRKS